MDKKVLDRISKNEKRLDTVGDYLNNLEAILAEFRKNKEEYGKLNKYYGSNEWFQDKENFEKGFISNVKAGVLSEDAVWDLNEKFNEIVSEMKELVEEND